MSNKKRLSGLFAFAKVTLFFLPLLLCINVIMMSRCGAQESAKNKLLSKGADSMGDLMTSKEVSLIADYRVAKEKVLRAIPEKYIKLAREKLHIMYCGTSHSSQLVDGLRGLMQYKPGDSELYKVSFDGEPRPGTLDIDYRPQNPVDVLDALDLSHDYDEYIDEQGQTRYFKKTIKYLDHPEHADVNVVMWSWCSIQGHDVQIYLDNFSRLIDMYKAGGTKGRTESNAVTFVFMSGYARGEDADKPEPPYLKSPYQNRQRISEYCRKNGHFMVDYWSHDVYDYETDKYFPEGSGNNNKLHRKFVDTHEQAKYWFLTRDFNSGKIHWPAHCDGEKYRQHLTSNRRAYAAWWVFARLVGWDGWE